MRLVVSAVCLLVLAACASPTDAPPPPAPTGPIAGDAHALAARLVPGTLAPSFARLAGTAYTARVVVEQLDADGNRTGRFERTVRHTPGAPDRVVAARASGTLADTAGLDPAQLTISDPLPQVLADAPAYVAPATRDQYTVQAGPLQGTIRQVDVRHTADTEQPVERATATLDVATGDVLQVAIARQSTSAIYDEATRVDVRMQPSPGGPIPQAVETTSIVSTPLSGTTTYRVAWTITPAAINERRLAEPLAPRRP